MSRAAHFDSNIRRFAVDRPFNPWSIAARVGVGTGAWTKRPSAEMPVSQRATESGQRAKNASACGSCQACPSDERAACDDVKDAPYAGWSLAKMALFYFLVPVLCAIVCASLAPVGVSSQSLAALGGLIGGMLLTTSLAARWTRQRDKHNRGGAPPAPDAKEKRDG